MPSNEVMFRCWPTVSDTHIFTRTRAYFMMWHQSGGWMSVNAASLVGAYGPETRNMARRCMERGWVSFLCSDAHGLRHMHALKELQQSSVVAKWMASSSCRHQGLGI